MSFEEFKAKRASLFKEKREPCPKEIPCPHCKGSGKERCTGECKGAGTVVCPNCKGTGEITCFGCSGTGMMDGKEHAFCKGTGKTACTINTAYKDHSKIPCADCNGRGTWPCPHCNGKSKVACPQCDGKGEKVTKVWPTLGEWRSALGEPAKKQVIQSNTYYYYSTKDGLVQVMMIFGRGGEPTSDPSCPVSSSEPALY